MSAIERRQRISTAERAFTKEWDRLYALHPAQVASWALLGLMKRLFDYCKALYEVEKPTSPSV
jgi:hypothetical protein